MADPVGVLIGDYRAFAAQQRDRLTGRGIDIAPYVLSHLAFRVPEWDQYVHLRTRLERHAVANSENMWNGPPISIIVLAEPLLVRDDKPVSVIELIPPVHQRVCRVRLEHLGVVVGDEAGASRPRTFSTILGLSAAAAPAASGMGAGPPVINVDGPEPG